MRRNERPDGVEERRAGGVPAVAAVMFTVAAVMVIVVVGVVVVGMVAVTAAGAGGVMPGFVVMIVVGFDAGRLPVLVVTVIGACDGVVPPGVAASRRVSLPVIVDS